MAVRVWGRDGIDDNTIRQAEMSARCPVVSGDVALMPDAHVGIGATVGSVIPTRSALIPSAVGVDIGCGMIAVQTTLSAGDLPDTLQPLWDQFARSVPAGVGGSRNLLSTGQSDRAVTRKAEGWLDAHRHDLSAAGKAAGEAQRLALGQLGTLGSGNHFLEVCLDETDAVWVVLHSGSRGIGNRLASSHMKLARQLTAGAEDPDLSYFLQGTPEFDRYVSDMLWAQDYALENRELMVDAAVADLFRFVGKGREMQRINCHHNYAAKEMHDEEEVWITRKGAIRARAGDLGVIPGSMGAASFIVRGLGNPESYNSAAHGAGRRMSRGQARRELSAEKLEQIMEGKAWNRDARGLLDEHPEAYKSVEEVMEAQSDLVEVVSELHQILNYKGGDARRKRR